MHFCTLYYNIESAALNLHVFVAESKDDEVIRFYAGMHFCRVGFVCSIFTGHFVIVAVYYY